MRHDLLVSLSVVLASSVISAGCGHSRHADTGRGAQLPARTGPLATPSSSALTLTGDGVSDGVQLVVDLATTPQVHADWAPWACQAILPPDFVLGEATCVSDPAKTQPLTAAMARQVCSGSPDFGPAVEPTAAPGIPGCAGLRVAFYGFTPALATTLVTAR